MKNDNKIKPSNETSLNVTAFNIDSRFRDKEPKNVTDKKIFYLKKESINFTENSSIIEILLDNNEDYFDVNDRIKIDNFKINNKIISNNLYMVNKFNYLIINLNNHMIKPSKESQHLKIIFLDNTEDMIGNIPLNSITELKTIFTYSEIENIPSIIDTTFENPDKNLIFVELPFMYIDSKNIRMVENIVELEFDSFAGIPTKYINADYPITFKNNKGYHMITDVTSESIFIDINLEANNTITFDNEGTTISKIIKVQEGFVDSNYYIVNLPKNFTNVVRIELVSSEFFFADILIKDKGSKKNNVLHWQNIEDGDTIYSVNIDSGNYSPSNLLTEIINKTNLVKRKKYTEQTPLFNNFEIELNSDKQMITFKSFKYDIVPNSININAVEINDEFYFMMTIEHPNNFVEVGDTIEITNSESVSIVPANIINNSHTVYSVDKKIGTYSIILPNFNRSNNPSDSSGGETVTIKSRNLTRFLFDKSDSVGSVLGFKNVGNVNAITKFSHITTNKDEYIKPSIYNSIGNVDESINYLNFTGDNLYLLMYLNDFKSIYSNTTVENAFAKILLPGTLGDAVFNTFVNFPIEFDIPIASIDQFVVKFLYPDGSAPQFNNLEHSFTLLITELNKTNERIGVQSNNSSFVKELYDIKNKKF